MTLNARTFSGAKLRFSVFAEVTWCNLRQNYKPAMAGYQLGLHVGKDLRMKPRQKEEELQGRKPNC